MCGSSEGDEKIQYIFIHMVYNKQVVMTSDQVTLPIHCFRMVHTLKSFLSNIGTGNLVLQ